MQFLADENFPLDSVILLRKAGLDVSHVGEDYPGVSDEEVIGHSNQNGRMILTFDRDYGTLIYKRGLFTRAGIVYFRIDNFQPGEPAGILLSLLENPDIKLPGKFTVVSRDALRQRDLPSAATR